jgi:hypothetical protein
MCLASIRDSKQTLTLVGGGLHERRSDFWRIFGAIVETVLDRCDDCFEAAMALIGLDGGRTVMLAAGHTTNLKASKRTRHRTRL